jgi:hypothetical protein
MRTSTLTRYGVRPITSARGSPRLSVSQPKLTPPLRWFR